MTTGETPVVETYDERLAKYERRVSTVTWVGAGLLGLIALAAGDLAGTVFMSAPDLVKALLFTFALAAAASLAQARIGFEWAGTKIKRSTKEQDDNLKKPLSKEDEKWPEGYELAYNLGLVFVLLAAACVLVAAWWPVFAKLCR